MPHPTNWRLVVRYLALGVVVIWAVVLQVRLSAETVRLQRSLDFYVPFLMEPFAAKVTVPDYVTNWEKGHRPGADRVLRPGDRVVKVNGRPFTGQSIYLTELWNIQHSSRPETASWAFFSVTILTHDGRTREIEFSFPHCTCGMPDLFDVVFFSMAVPLFCIAIGALPVAVRPKSVLAWAWFGSLLALSQWQFWVDPHPGFQTIADPMGISGAMRVPAVAYLAFIQHSWPIALGVAAMHLGSRRRVNRPGWVLLGVLLLFAISKTAIAIGWSEGIRSMSPVYFLLRQAETEMLTVAFLLITAACWAADRKLGALATGIATCAITALFAGPAAISEGGWVSYSDNTRRFELSIPTFHRDPGAIIAISLTVFMLLAFLLFRRRLSWQPALSAAFCLPLAVHVSGALGNWWDMHWGPPIEEWRWIVALFTGIGLSLASYWIISRESNSARRRE